MIRKLTLGIALGLVLGATTASLAHPGYYWYPGTWTNASQPLRPHNGFPTGAMLDRVVDAMGTLNNVSGTGNQTINVAFPTSGKGFQNDCNHYDQGENVLYERVLSGGTRAVTHHCVNFTTGVIKWSQVSFDADSPWYTGSSTAVPSLKYDVQSVATHELLHFNGFGLGSSGHFTGNECDDPINTGCGEGSFTTGYAYWRTLEPHDIHTFQDAY